MILSARYGAVAASLPSGPSVAGAMELISAVTVATNTTYVTFSSIPQTYDDLKLVMCAYSSNAPSGNYTRVSHTQTGTTPTIYQMSVACNTSTLEVVDFITYSGFTLYPGGGPSGNVRSTGALYFPEYSRSGRFKRGMGTITDARNYMYYSFHTEVTDSTTTFDQIVLRINNYLIGAGSQFALYGITKA